MLVTYGVGLTVGNWLGGRYADRSVDRTLIVTLASLAVILVAFAVLMPFKVPTPILIFLWGIASFALVPPLQVRVMHAAADAPNLASAMNIGAFNLGNAIGAAVGGGMIAAGLGYAAVSLAGALASALGLVAVLASVRRKSALEGANLATAPWQRSASLSGRRRRWASAVYCAESILTAPLQARGASGAPLVVSFGRRPQIRPHIQAARSRGLPD
jgi:DHA1 family inner membrane transport protein